MPSNKIAVFIDYDNIKINMKTEPPEKLSEIIGYERLKFWLSQIGEIVVVFIFAPAVTIYANIEFFYKLGFISIACPVFRKTKKENPSLLNDPEFKEYEPEEIISLNTTDEVMIDLAKKIISQMSEITHICIVSADHHFIPIAQLAKAKGKKTMIVFSSYNPSRQLLTFADKNIDGRPMLHFFNPIQN